MKRVLLKISYDGTAYHGWQVQPNGVTVQETLQDALEKMLGERPAVTGCSRTDAGVHAREFFCHFDAPDNIPTHAFVAGLNCGLPYDISVLEARDVADDFHSRYRALGKRYVYYIDNGDVPDPFLRRYAHYVKGNLDIDKMNDFCRMLIGTHDFAAFSSIHRSVTDTVRTIKECCVSREGNKIILSVTADGFLYNMVRIIVGTALDAGMGKVPKGSFEEVFGTDRQKAGNTAPACGLFLDKVFY